MAGLWDQLKRWLESGSKNKTEAPASPAAPSTSPTPAATPPVKPAVAAPSAPASAPVSATPAAAKPATAPTSTTTSGTTATATAPYRTPSNPYDTSGILGLTAAEMRARSLKIDPYRTAWIGRVDTIPPQSDERTALIDRGLILRGMLTPEQITEIHRIGDLWIRKYDAVRITQAYALGVGEQAVQKRREERQKLRAKKKQEALEREAKRREEIIQRKATDIVFLGRGVSSGLVDRRSMIEKLAEQGLPVLAAPADVARALEMTIPRLRWLCFHSEATNRSHYVQFTVPKRSGGTRLLSAPRKELRRAQRWVLTQILAKIPVTEHAHGFVAERSTVTNAKPHLGRKVVINADLSDFFPTITFPRVRGIFRDLGYSPAVSTVLALLCTESPRREVSYAGKPYFVAVGPRALPQGACTSPALSNLAARKLDRRLAGLCTKAGWTYTRYADDLTFSTDEPTRTNVPKLLAAVEQLVKEESFAINPKKGRIQRIGNRQTVTGVVVNKKLGVPREEVRRLRAILHQAKHTGLEAQNREKRPHFEAWLQGKIAYISMIDPDRGAQLRKAFEALGA